MSATAAAVKGVRLNPPPLEGVLLGVNAIPDASLVIDGPACVFAKAEQVHGRHDLFSTLLSPSGEHRVHHSGVDAFNAAVTSETRFVSVLERAAARAPGGVLLAAAMPVCAVAGTDYARLLSRARAPRGTDRAVVPPALSGDWLDGYDALLARLAAGLTLESGRPRKRTVAVVGWLFDRNEGDQRASVGELERLVRGAGLEPESVWLSGRPAAHLRRAGRAAAIVSLPHGRKAARALAERLGVPVHEAPLPVGLDASRRFVTGLGGALGDPRAARSFCDAELDRVAPRLEWTVPHAFLGRRFGLGADPHHALALAGFIEELGGRLTGALITGARRHLTEPEASSLGSRARAVFEPWTREAAPGGTAAPLWDDADLIVSNTLVLESLRPRGAWIEHGYPSEHEHFLSDAPYAGFEGALRLASRAANELVRGMSRRRSAR